MTDKVLRAVAILARAKEDAVWRAEVAETEHCWAVRASELTKAVDRALGALVEGLEAEEQEE